MCLFLSINQLVFWGEYSYIRMVKVLLYTYMYSLVYSGIVCFHFSFIETSPKPENDDEEEFMFDVVDDDEYVDL